MKSLNKWLALCGAVVSVLSVGCGAPMEGETPPEDAASEGEVSASVCSYGYYTCPNDGEIFEYESLACAPAYMSKTRAKSLCEEHCPSTCRDSGWMTY
ncbi:hypothetical protein HPC49_23475 [Pyxidicoccus fallax]|uniref:Lipoprotein n=1 Tax=Pyxidicoccus fallax TaxID=394095 RepID=A0A848LY66_9BACT|nr:hypothetical protein [Pyxidicoccus fallax]NMO22766.1 hypothetical protein [Pyxidicoccus fallax]NPC81176.1 hypothetical protein [Pyxidicoccus fallax]